MVRFLVRNHGGSEFESYHYHRKTLTTVLKKITFFLKKKKARSIVVSSANQEEISIPSTQILRLADRSTTRHLVWDTRGGCLGRSASISID